VTEALNARGYRAEALHGGMSQEQRDRVMKKLRGGTAELLLATDVAARGLDIDVLTHVINYDVPSAPESYVHRIGRVGRAGREGVAITLAEPREHRLLKNIERVAGKIEIGKVPTVADLKARRMDLTKAALRESILDEEASDHFRVVVDALSDEFDIVDIAIAAVRMAHEATHTGDDDGAEIPAAAPIRDGGSGGTTRERGPVRKASRGGNMTRIYVGLGRSNGVRPQDLVGAITGEAGLAGRDVGAIEIGDRFSLVEVPTDSVNKVIDALKGTTIKGKRAIVRREKFER
jgi:ATP-dependent RNA helicase DeaD